MPRTPRLALTAVAAALALSACGGDDDVATPTTAPTTSTPSASSGTGSPTPEPTTTAAGEAARAIYYVMDTTNGPRLYREFASRPETGDILGDAVQTMLTRPADDPEYDNLWPAGSEVLSARVEGTTAFVDLSQEATEGSAGSAFEAASLQQLVHTVTAAEPSAEQVQLLVEGRQVDTLWGATDTSRPLGRGPAAEVLGPVWVLTPTEGGNVARGGEVGGVATVFEATVNWQWLQGDTVVKEGFSTATEGAPGRGDWTAPVDLPPGDYVLKAFESSAEDGSETFVDTKSVTVTG